MAQLETKGSWDSLSLMKRYEPVPGVRGRHRESINKIEPLRKEKIQGREVKRKEKSKAGVIPVHGDSPHSSMQSGLYQIDPPAVKVLNPPSPPSQGGRSHLTATNGSPASVAHSGRLRSGHILLNELSHKTGNEIAVFFQGKVPRVKYVEFQVFQVTLVRMCSFLRENKVVLSPDD